MKKLLLTTFVFVLLSAFSHKLFYVIAEKYFFEKLIYQKALSYGYWNLNKSLELKDFSPRSDDILALSGIDSVDKKKQFSVLGHSSDVFTIAMVGDSYVWGQGVKEQDRFPVVLEKELNKIRNTKVLSLAECGDSALDNLHKFQLAEKTYSIDLYIFVTVDNDMLFNQEPRYIPSEYEELIQQCEKIYSKKVIRSLDQISVKNLPLNQQEEQYYQHMSDAINSLTNRCVLDQIISLYPKNAIYFIPDNYYETNDILNTYRNALWQQNLYVLSSTKAKAYPKYEKYWSNPEAYFRVSSIESHPSALANRMYTDVLVEEIISNPKWKFVIEE